MIKCVYDITGSGMGTYVKKWIKTQFQQTESLDEKFNNVFTQGKGLLE